MPEIKNKVETITKKVNYICERCGIGHMKVEKPWDKYDHLVTWNHICDHCGQNTEMTKRYPHITREYIDVEEEENG